MASGNALDHPHGMSDSGRKRANDDFKSDYADRHARKRSASPGRRHQSQREDWARHDKPATKRDADGFPIQNSAEGDAAEKPEKEKINLNQSGLLAAEQNTYKGVVIKYSEPPEARVCDVKWRLHVFKGNDQLDVIRLTRQSAFLVGKDRVVVDIAVDHPSCSKQHAAIQFRQVTKRDQYGETQRLVKYGRSLIPSLIRLGRI